MARDNYSHLARFRADPKLVRVAVKRCGARWEASVGPHDMDPSKTYSEVSDTPYEAVFDALIAADGNVQGVDICMDRVYDHPFRDIANA